MTHTIYRTLNLGILQVGIMPGLFWFRIFGRGLHIKDSRRHPLLWSQRYHPTTIIFGYRVRPL